MMNLEDLALRNMESIRLAGPRYSPGIDPKAPNVQIQYLIDAIDALSLSRGFRDRLNKYARDLEKAAEYVSRSVQVTVNKSTVTP